MWKWLCVFLSLSGFLQAKEPFLTGRVVDDEGRPVAGATVKIWDCIGTCLGGATRMTDQQGRYTFENREFLNWPSLAVSMPGRYHAATEYLGPQLHEESDEPRIANFVLGTPAAVSLAIEATVPEGWSQTVALRAGRGVQLHRYDITGRHSPTGWNQWHFEIVPRHEPIHVVVTRKPVVEPAADKETQRERERSAREQEVEIISPAIRLLEPQRHHLKVRIVDAEAAALPRIELVSLRDGLGQDRTHELAVHDPFFGPPVSSQQRQQAMDWLDRVAVAAKPWNHLPGPHIKSYEYDAVDARGEVTHIVRDRESSTGPAWADISRIRGFAFMPPVRWLTSQPENVEIYGFQLHDDRATLTYRLKQRRGFSAGLGVGPGWNGFFSRSFSAGELVIDTTNSTILTHRLYKDPLDDESTVTYGEYVSIEGGGFVPQTMRIHAESHDYRMTFHIHPGNLWLLNTAHHGDQAEPALTIRNVNVQLAKSDE